jgi:hypothetical protein
MKNGTRWIKVGERERVRKESSNLVVDVQYLFALYVHKSKYFKVMFT